MKNGHLFGPPLVHAALLFATWICTPLAAQADEHSMLVANRDKKLASPFLRCAAWTTTLDDARAAAKASQRLILGYFTRSYAPCGPCVQLEQTVFAKPEFVAFARSVVPFCHVSTRLEGDPSAFLLAEKGGSAFPTLMILDADGNVLARKCGVRGMRDVTDLLAEGEALAARIRGAADAPAAERADVLARRIELGHLDAESARAAVRALGPLPPEREAWFDAAITARACAVAFLEIRKARDDEGRLAAAGGLAALARSGAVPPEAHAPEFWNWVLCVAAQSNDVALYEKGLAAARRLDPGDPESAERLRLRELALERMRRDAAVGAVATTEASGSR